MSAPKSLATPSSRPSDPSRLRQMNVGVPRSRILVRDLHVRPVAVVQGAELRDRAPEHLAVRPTRLQGTASLIRVPYSTIRAICCGSNSSQSVQPTSNTSDGRPETFSRAGLPSGATR